MKAKLETTDPDTIAALQPIIEIVQRYPGQIDRARTQANASFVEADQRNRQILLAQIVSCPAAEQFVIGAGSGHIYINRPTACRVEDRELTSVNGIFDRVLLITD